MVQTRSKYEFYQEATLSQKLAALHPEYQEYAGSDYEISRSIAILRVLGKHGHLDLEQPMMKLIMDILNEKRKAAFATSERTNEITKMGLQMPRGEEVIDAETE